MSITTIAEVLEHVDEFERMLADFYAKVVQASTRDGVRLLTDYMSRHRQRTLKALAKLPDKQMQNICRTPMKYELRGADRSCFEEINLPEDATAAEILDAAIEFDEHLIQFYRQVLKQPVNKEIKEIFEGLVRFEQQDQIELKKIKALDYF